MSRHKDMWDKLKEILERRCYEHVFERTSRRCYSEEELHDHLKQLVQNILTKMQEIEQL